MAIQTLPDRAAAARAFLGAHAAQDPAAVAYLQEALDAEEAMLTSAPLPPSNSLRGQYLQAAMAGATYAMDATEDRLFGSIPACPGVWASEATPETCALELISTLNDWLSAQLAAGTSVPVLGGVDLNPRHTG